MSSEQTTVGKRIGAAVDEAMEPAHAVDERATTEHAHEGNAHGLTDIGYVKVAAILAFMTALEVTLTYLDLPGGVFMTALLGLMALKFWTVVSYFMHLKFDNKLFTKLFYTGLFLSLSVFVVVLLTFQFFAPSS